MNYTNSETKKLIEMYIAEPNLDNVSKLSVYFNKPKKSIISKLVKEGVYVRKGYRTKTGSIPITKLQIVRDLEDLLDVKLTDLDKAPKSTLMNLRRCIEETIDTDKELRDIRIEMLDAETLKLPHLKL